MAKKQAITKETAIPATAPAAGRVAKPNTPRVTAAKHSKVVAPESAIEASSIEVVVVPTSVPTGVPTSAQPSSVNTEEVIAKIAYGYWESRGYQGGSPHEDWVRAEHEHRQRLAATRL